MNLMDIYKEKLEVGSARNMYYSTSTLDLYIFLRIRKRRNSKPTLEEGVHHENPSIKIQKQQPSCLGSSGKELLPRTYPGEYRVRFPGGTTLGQCACLYT
ncbi:hypothetical protein MtrunA17_Chr8g0346841 [Medicago truncatula]|uniref:Uncharacterized protein n=1 Tax=Medicago truncatula TaxID=3880 RepID=G8A2V7_MEDTR|nr:hypothetical protein MTR_8g027555 [Medicago truncatula]RHN39713.1 hypothetical protein MtrunA17_Chr8g0346841 [Medicago truncatula]